MDETNNVAQGEATPETANTPESVPADDSATVPSEETPTPTE